jgi:hypothetical protein
MRVTLTISLLFFLVKARAQNELRSITVRNKTVEIKYDSVVQSGGIKYDTIITKSCTKYKASSTCKIDTSFTQTRVTKPELITATKIFNKPLEMKFIFSTLTASVFALSVNGQIFNASKYGFGWTTDTTGYTPQPPSEQTWGALWSTWSGSQALQATNSFSPAFSEIRAQVIFTSWNGINSGITEQYLTSGKKVLLNVHPFPQSDTAHYSNINFTTWQGNVHTLVNSVSKPDDVVLSSFNEENSNAYIDINSPSDLQPYIQSLSILARTAAARGIKVSNGGLTTNAITYRFLSDTHSPDTTNFLHYCVPANVWNGVINRTNPGIETFIANVQYLLTHYDTIPVAYLPYISVHMYFPLPLRMNDTSTTWRESYTGITQIKQMIDYYCPGREIITSEMGFVANNTALVSNVVADLISNDFKHILYWNSPGGEDEVIPIATAPGTPTVLGNFYKSQIQ